LDDLGEGTQLQLVRHQGGVEANHFASMTHHDGCSNDRPRALLRVDLCKAFRFAVQDGAVHLMERLYEGGNSEPSGLGLSGGEADVGDLRICIRAPGDGQG
jgi:hypothetical protein